VIDNFRPGLPSLVSSSLDLSRTFCLAVHAYPIPSTLPEGQVCLSQSSRTVSYQLGQAWAILLVSCIHTHHKVTASGVASPGPFRFLATARRQIDGFLYERTDSWERRVNLLLNTLSLLFFFCYAVPLPLFLLDLVPSTIPLPLLGPPTSSSTSSFFTSHSPTINHSPS
jgi:hypothetical protein